MTGILLDLAKVFDPVNHAILLIMLERYGVRGLLKHYMKVTWQIGYKKKEWMELIVMQYS